MQARDRELPDGPEEGWLRGSLQGELALLGVGSLPAWAAESGWGAVVGAEDVVFVLLGRVVRSALPPDSLGEYLCSAASIVCMEGLGPAGVLQRASALASALDSTAALEVLCAAIYPSRRLLQVAGAGSPPVPLLAQEGRVAALQLPGLGDLGGRSGLSGQRSLPLAPGSVLAFLGGAKGWPPPRGDSLRRAFGSFSLSWALRRPQPLGLLHLDLGRLLAPGTTLVAWLVPRVARL